VSNFSPLEYCGYEKWIVPPLAALSLAYRLFPELLIFLTINWINDLTWICSSVAERAAFLFFSYKALYSFESTPHPLISIFPLLKKCSDEYAKSTSPDFGFLPVDPNQLLLSFKETNTNE
jgi:hypothetical protein